MVGLLKEASFGSLEVSDTQFHRRCSIRRSRATGRARTRRPDRRSQRSRMMVNDNGTEPSFDAVLVRSDDAGVEWHQIMPGKPTRNGFGESLHGPIRDDLHEKRVFTNNSHRKSMIRRLTGNTFHETHRSSITELQYHTLPFAFEC